MSFSKNPTGEHTGSRHVQILPKNHKSDCTGQIIGQNLLQRMAVLRRKGCCVVVLVMDLVDQLVEEIHVEHAVAPIKEKIADN